MRDFFRIFTVLIFISANISCSENNERVDSNVTPPKPVIISDTEPACDDIDCEAVYSKTDCYDYSRSYSDEKWDTLPDFEYLKSIYNNHEDSDYSSVKRIVRGEIERDEAVSTSFSRLGIPYGVALELSEAFKDVFDFRWCRVGNSWAIEFDENNEIIWFALYYNRLETYYARNEDGVLHSYKLIGKTDVYTVPIAGTITNSLSVALWKLGETDALTMKIADIFAWDIDFYSDLQKGDTFKVLVEKRYYAGKFLGYGRVYAASFHGLNLGNMYAVYFETPDKKRAEYFDEKNNSLQKSFLRAPLNTVRVTSKYGFRMHPTLHKYKKHNGIDFGAPRGTPVWAIASGKVLKSGWMGPCGKGIVLRHANAYESIYCHLSKINVKAGTHVRQKDMIGRVGSTGRSTGPHLHFGLKKYGKYINPANVKYEPGKPVDEKYMEAWLPIRDDMVKKLDEIELPVFYGPKLPPEIPESDIDKETEKKEVPFDHGELLVED